MLTIDGAVYIWIRVLVIWVLRIENIYFKRFWTISNIYDSWNDINPKHVAFAVI